MKKLVQINTVCNTSTGKLMGDIQRKACKAGYETLSIVGRRKVFADVPCIKIGNPVSFWIHVAITTVFDRQGYGSYFMTRKIVRRLREEQPDIIHLHNLHGYYLNLPLLFDYLSKEFKGDIYWTFHDCWPITGHCAHFSAVGCEKWKSGCGSCPNKMVYPISLLMDSSAANYEDKKRMFCSLKNLTIITPSEWMAGWIRNSYLKQFPVKVINNGIDLGIFHYRKPEKELYDKYGISPQKKILLGVAGVWSKYKGLQDFVLLAGKLPAEYQIVLAGLSHKQHRGLPDNITGIERTESVEELSGLYSMAHLFINPSLEESFSLVTVEALACGTPAIVLDTSAVKELICSENGIVLTKHDAEDYLDAVHRLEEKNLSRETVRRTAMKYDAELYAEKVIKLYEQM